MMPDIVYLSRSAQQVFIQKVYAIKMTGECLKKAIFKGFQLLQQFLIKSTTKNRSQGRSTCMGFNHFIRGGFDCNWLYPPIYCKAFA
jgi:hypothetical protein